MSIQNVAAIESGRWNGRSVSIEAMEENLSSDGGLFLFGQLDKELGWTRELADLICDSRVKPTQSTLSIVQQRVFGIIAGYEDQNDHDSLRTDPVFKLIAGRRPDEEDLASQPTISRLENSVTAAELLKIEDWFIDRFVASFNESPERITLDIDTSDDPVHGQQQLSFFHGFYQQHQYLIRLITCEENDMVVLPVLLIGNAVAKIGAIDDLCRVIERLRERFPNVRIHIRGDSAFGGPREYDMLESLPNVTYSFGMKINRRTKRLSAELLEETEAIAKKTGKPQVRYLALENYSTKYWAGPKTVVVKVEVTAHSSSRRTVITNVKEAATDPEATYREYAQRGESENRNKELKCDLQIDRLSDHRYMANLFRVMLHCVAHNLVVAMRGLIRIEDAPDASDEPSSELPTPESRSVKFVGGDYEKRHNHNARRRKDLLGKAHPVTWRMMVIKVAARVVVSARRVRLIISSSWPNLAHLRRTADAVRVSCQR